MSGDVFTSEELKQLLEIENSVIKQLESHNAFSEPDEGKHLIID